MSDDFYAKMNATELADHMEKFFSEDYTWDVVNMLRQQQAEIAELRKFISLDENRGAEWYAYELDNEMKRYKKTSEK